MNQFTLQALTVRIASMSMEEINKENKNTTGPTSPPPTAAAIGPASQQPTLLLLHGDDQQPHREPPSLAEMIDVKKQKRLMTEGTELFNRHSPQKGVEFLCEKGLLKNPLEPQVH
jgi:hypothetical protein